METLSIRKMATECDTSHTTLLKHIRKSVVRPDTEDGRFYPESVARVRREVAANRLSKWRHCSN